MFAAEGIPESPVDTTSDAFAIHPIEGYERIRNAGRLVYVPAARAFLITGYRDVADLLRNPKFHALHYPAPWHKIGEAAGMDYSAAIALLSYMPFAHEGQRHDALRTAMAQGIAPIAGGWPGMEASIAQSLRRAVRDGGLDLARDFACHLLFDIMCDFMKIPQSDRSGLRPLATLSWAVESTITANERRFVSDHTRYALDYLRAHAAAQITASEAGLLRSIHDGLPDEEEDKLWSTAVLAAVMLVMGNDALGACISMGARRLLDPEYPDPVPQELWASVSDDAIRYSSPVDYVIRKATEDGLVAECPIKTGEYVFSSMLAANHDPEQYGDEAELLRPKTNVGLAFGAGRHLCVGSRVTRTVVKGAFSALASLPRMAMAGNVEHGRGKLVRVLTSVPVEFV